MDLPEEQLRSPNQRMEKNTTYYGGQVQASHYRLRKKIIRDRKTKQHRNGRKSSKDEKGRAVRKKFR